jgi:hypothetical protein
MEISTGPVLTGGSKKTESRVESGERPNSPLEGPSRLSRTLTASETFGLSREIQPKPYAASTKSISGGEYSSRLTLGFAVRS